MVTWMPHVGCVLHVTHAPAPAQPDTRAPRSSSHAQVTSVFARRGYNVQSLAVGPSEREGMSRICMVVPGTQPAVDKLLKQVGSE